MIDSTDIQRADLGFFGPITAAYVAVCLGWFTARSLHPKPWDRAPLPPKLNSTQDSMKSIAGSILVLAAAVLLQPAVENSYKFDEAILFAGPVLIVAVFFLIAGLGSKD